ncbi:MAG: DUF2256 domain-containing protein [Jatrophihabitans sp.]|uniref:DUF2256 domain-containing protein n=1 Tax=Jatrophihabitans sp. TaxID=1932789 RepID=UPI003F7D5A95
MAGRPSKTCASCGRRFEWRKKWERDWDAVRYCSTACRRRGVTDVDAELEAALRAALPRRGATADPQDAARSVGGEAWRDLLEPARRAARRLVAAGEAEVVVAGRVVDPSTAKGDWLVRRR